MAADSVTLGREGDSMGDPEGSNDPRWDADVRALEERGRQAFVAGDVDTLSHLWSERLLVNSPLDRIHGKAQVLQLLQAGVIRHHTLDSEVEAIERYGDTVVVMGGDRVIDSPGGQTIHRRFTNVWQADGPSWRLIARQATIVQPSPAQTGTAPPANR
jgi:ketosteroid isomerase-like protein